MHDNSKLLKHRNFIKSTLNVCLTALNDSNYVEIYSQKWWKSLQKDLAKLDKDVKFTLECNERLVFKPFLITMIQNINV